MANLKREKCDPNEKCKKIYVMSWLGVRVSTIALHYKITQPTVSNIIRQLRMLTAQKRVKKMRRKRKLSEKGIRLLDRYGVDNFHEPLYTIIDRFNATTRLLMSKRIDRNYISRLNMDCYIVFQQPEHCTTCMMCTYTSACGLIALM